MFFIPGWEVSKYSYNPQGHLPWRLTFKIHQYSPELEVGFLRSWEKNNIYLFSENNEDSLDQSLRLFASRFKLNWLEYILGAFI